MTGAVTITNQQSSLVDIVFNFGAILIIAELVNILMKTFPFKSMKVLVPIDFEPDEVRFDRTSCEMGEFAYSGAFMTFLMLSGR